MTQSLDTGKSAADIAFAQGIAAQQANDLDASIRFWSQAIALYPRHEPALYNLAVALTFSKDEKNAEGVYRALLTLRPDHQNALFNLANMKKRQGKDAEAEQLYRDLIGLHPTFATGWVNLALLYSERGDLENAEPLLRRALAIDPEHVHAHWNLSHLLLQQHRWGEAWHEYEWRLLLPHWLKPPVAAPAWTPEVKAKRILLWNDQGIGDALQFLRYPRLLAERGYEIWLMTQPELKPVAARAPGVTGALSPLDETPPFDAQAPLLSLPLRLSMPSPQEAGTTPYLPLPAPMPLPQRKERFAVGLVWAGNQNFKNNANRSLPLSALRPLFDMPNIDWFSLQFGAAKNDIAANNLSEKIYDLTPHLNDFADTSAALAALDLLICVDTSAAHLAGALGRPCWVLLSAKPDWRWQGESSPWYPALRLFKQTSAGNWHGVAEQTATALKQLFA